VLVGCAKPVSFLDQSWMAANSTISMLAAGRWVARQPASHLASTSPSFSLSLLENRSRTPRNAPSDPHRCSRQAKSPEHGGA